MEKDEEVKPYLIGSNHGLNQVWSSGLHQARDTPTPACIILTVSSPLLIYGPAVNFKMFR